MIIQQKTSKFNSVVYYYILCILVWVATYLNFLGAQRLPTDISWDTLHRIRSHATLHYEICQLGHTSPLQTKPGQTFIYLLFSFFGKLSNYVPWDKCHFLKKIDESLAWLGLEWAGLAWLAPNGSEFFRFLKDKTNQS